VHRFALAQQRGFEGGGSQHFEIAAADFRVRVLGRDHFALFGDADLALHRAGRLREDGLIARAATAADRTAAAVEQAHAHVVPFEHLHQRVSALYSSQPEVRKPPSLFESE
jgi:hypothetical protein